MSLRASAPVFSGYASVVLSQQLEPLAPRPAPPAAASTAAQEARAQPTVSGALRGSVESGASGAASSAAAGASGASSQLHQSELHRSGSGVQREEEVVSQAADPAAAETQVPAQEADQPASPAAQVQEPLEEKGVIGPTASETPAALRQRPGVQDLLQPGVQPGGPAGATPSSGGNSSGTNKVGEPGRTVGLCLRGTATRVVQPSAILLASHGDFRCGRPKCCSPSRRHVPYTVPGSIPPWVRLRTPVPAAHLAAERLQPHGGALLAAPSRVAAAGRRHAHKRPHGWQPAAARTGRCQQPGGLQPCGAGCSAGGRRNSCSSHCATAA